MLFLKINAYLSCHIGPGAAGSVKYHAKSTFFCQEVVKSQIIVRHCLSKETLEVLSLLSLALCVLS